MSTHTTPRVHRTGRALGPATGRFVSLGSKVLLLDSSGNRWPLEQVSIVTSFWGGGDEGVRKLPRPWVYDSITGAVKVTGDLVVIDFLDGNPRKPIVRGVAASIAGDRDFMPYNHAEDADDSNRLVVRLRPVDSSGNDGGTVELEVGGGDGSLALRVTDGLVIEVGPIDAPLAVISMASSGTVVVQGPAVYLGGTAIAEPMIMGTAFTQQLINVLLELAAAATALGLPTTETVIMIANLGFSQILGAPYLTTKTKAE